MSNQLQTLLYEGQAIEQADRPTDRQRSTGVAIYSRGESERIARVMCRSSDRSEEDVEIVDSGHAVATRNPNAGAPAFWAVVENEAAERRITVELQLCDSSGVLVRYEQTHTVAASARERYRFAVEPPDRFDQYVFSVVRREPPTRSPDE